MLLIIDGYNLLKQLYGAQEISEGQRKKFIELLYTYAAKKKHRIKLIFDGGSYEWPHKERSGLVGVIYSGYQSTADDYIMQMLQEKQKSDVLLVSSDHELGLFAAQLDVPSINSLDFYHLMQQSIHQQPAQGQPLVDDELVQFRAENEQLDALMRDAAQDIAVKEEDVDTAITVPRKQNRGSRRERKLLSKLKKL